MRFTTETGSLYECNVDSKQARRLNGKSDPTPRMGKDGQWRKYREVFPDPIVVGSQVMIAWESDTPLLEETKVILGDEGGMVLPTTMTSRVVSIER